MNKKKIIDKLLIVSIVVMASVVFDKTDRRDDGSHCYA